MSEQNPRRISSNNTTQLKCRWNEFLAVLPLYNLCPYSMDIFHENKLQTFYLERGEAPLLFGSRELNDFPLNLCVTAFTLYS